METARCKAFLYAAETGSITKAAEELSYTPSGVSQLIQAFENEIGNSKILKFYKLKQYKHKINKYCNLCCRGIQTVKKKFKIFHDKVKDYFEKIRNIATYLYVNNVIL